MMTCTTFIASPAKAFDEGPRACATAQWYISSQSSSAAVMLLRGRAAALNMLTRRWLPFADFTAVNTAILAVCLSEYHKGSAPRFQRR